MEQMSGCNPSNSPIEVGTSRLDGLLAGPAYLKLRYQSLSFSVARLWSLGLAPGST
jgi:hypothetical protein